jgi:vacuolar-type H+-ATPase subunit E/Vma4
LISGVNKIVLVTLLLMLAPIVRAQSTVTTIVLGADQIGKVKTAQGISTRITFPEPVSEIICGDLYDAASGKGLFVVQSSGDERQRGNSVYLKPVATKGVSNLFVTTGEKGKNNTYNFDLEIVPMAQAHRVVNVFNAATPPSGSDPSASGATQPSPKGGANGGESAKPSSDPEQRRGEIEQQARTKADETLRLARQQADRIVGEAEARALEIDRQAAQRGEQEAQHKFVQALMLGIREVRVSNPRTMVKKVIVLLDPRIVMIDDKAYLRYTIQNTSDQIFSFNAIALERTAAAETQPIAVEVHQSKAENKLDPGEVMNGVLVFDPKVIAPKDKLNLFLRGEANAELIRVNIQ